MKFRALLLATVLVLPAACQAQDVSDDEASAIIDKVIEGYGGSKFENLKTLRIKTDLRYGWLGQGQYPDYTDLEPMRKTYHFDLEKGWGSEEAWGGRGGYAERVFTTDAGQYTVNYPNNTWELDEEADFYSHFGGEIRGSDLLLAYDLLKHKDTASIVGAKMFRGAVHDLITYDMPGTSIDPVLWVSSETGLISKMRRDVPDFNVLNYVFGNHINERGISYADDFELYVGDKLIEYAKSIELDVGGVRSSIWNLDDDVEAMPETVSSDEMVVDHIAGKVHYAGSGGGWGAFVDVGDHIIGIGAYGNVRERFTAYQSAQDHQKPLKYQIVTHHHSDHLEGVADALKLGAKIVAPEMARANLNEVADRTLSESELMIATEEKTTLGPVELYIISTSHAPEFLLPFVPEGKIIIDEDHYFGNFKDRPSRISPNAMSFIGEVKRLGLSPEIHLGTHGRKAEQWSKILKASEQFRPGLCPTGRKICLDLVK